MTRKKNLILAALLGAAVLLSSPTTRNSGVNEPPLRNDQSSESRADVLAKPSPAPNTQLDETRTNNAGRRPHRDAGNVAGAGGNTLGGGLAGVYGGGGSGPSGAGGSGTSSGIIRQNPPSGPAE